ncbi:hypothetical protein [Pacificoceanicola onchidii]|uniref:hypothetical protein n=1 Tax=Pacificoceanicola onchidii TaxID=2562685 RepID=UPI0014560E54|nr:hypothetical protein [Pacificoceanicola onchidii]
MVLRVARNGGYGGVTAMQKYNPLSSVTITAAESAYCSAILEHRCEWLDDRSIFPQTLTFYMADHAAAIAGENGKPPPLVVVTSNRSRWIAAGLETGRLALAAMPGDATSFAGIRDGRAFGGADRPVSPPIYAPYRQGPGSTRSIYVLVHASEYATYRANLDAYGVTVVGWKFTAVPADRAPLAGFGVSRFAAIAFCKALRAETLKADGATCWDKAWTIDDNVIGMQGFPGFTTAEAALDAAWVCLGFNGKPLADTRADNRAQFSSAAVPGPPPPLPPAATSGIIQQVALWNIAKMTADRTNFSPTYVASAEDLSLTRYFNITNTPYRFYTGSVIWKENVVGDYYDGSLVFQSARRTSEADFVTAEATTPAGGAAPPLQVRVKATDPAVTARAFAIDPVLQLSKNISAADRGNAAVRNRAACQISEQITKTSIGKAGIMTPASLAAAFALPDDSVPIAFQDLNPAVAGGGDDTAAGGGGDDTLPAGGGGDDTPPAGGGAGGGGGGGGPARNRARWKQLRKEKRNNWRRRWRCKR